VSSAARPAAPEAERRLWRIPVALLLVAAAAATGWYFARRADAPQDPEVHVVRVGGPEDAPPTPSASPVPEPASHPATRPPEPDAAVIPSAAASYPASPPPVRSATPPGAAGSAVPRRPASGLEQLLAEGDAAATAGDIATAIARYEAFMKRAGEAHPQYYVIESRVEGLRTKLPPR